MSCTVCGKTNHTKKDCKFKDMECSICGKVGHLKAVCRQAEGGGWSAKVDKPCTVCGKTNHVKKDCKFKDRECSVCGKVGHLAAMCRQADGGAKAAAGGDKPCLVCGKTNHVKKDCKFKDKECSICGKVGHLKAMCRQADGSAKNKEDAPAKEKKQAKQFKVCVCGGAGGIGQPMSMLMAMDSNVGELNIFDLNIAMVPPAGVAADLGHLEKKAKVTGYVMEVGKNPIEYLEECLTGCHLVLIPAGMPRKPGQSRDDLFKINADIAKGLVEACAKYCPEAVLGMIVNPVNSIVPAMAELYKKKGLDPLKIVGITTLDCVRANKFVGEITGKNPNFINVPVIGGHAGTTIMPVFSQDKIAKGIDAEKIADLDKHVQDAGTEVVNAKGGKGSATLSMAYAGAKLGSAILAGLAGRRRVECAYVASTVSDLPYFASKVVFGEKGVSKILPIGELNEHETKRLAEASELLKAEIETGMKYAEANEFSF